MAPPIFVELHVFDDINMLVFRILSWQDDKLLQNPPPTNQNNERQLEVLIFPN